MKYINKNIHNKKQGNKMMSKYQKQKEALREYAIQLQHDLSQKSISYSELIEIQNDLEKRAKRLGLIKELKENCLI